MTTEAPQKPYSIVLLPENEVQRAIDIRIEVFVHEQKFSMEDELDDKDSTSDHFILLSPSGTDAGTIRFHPPTGKLGRLAVLKEHRGTGVGKLLVEALEEHVRMGRGRGGVYARERGLKEVVVEAMAQWQAEPFYQKCGFETLTGERIIEDGYPHIKMVKTVKLEA
ncbi:acyl-CoA N-acyltransferase [Leucosporidium creatinivorum]|uniref:Probable N-acetyltransferase 14 n=1 Tax=Leucosporidium creatinivorum TaxID=106004 RepID=A0A1Y2G0U7_9BASI|nr:acyl-CoA N-acyltransferase [Leucosporidium creatinivorum]